MIEITLTFPTLLIPILYYYISKITASRRSEKIISITVLDDLKQRKKDVATLQHQDLERYDLKGSWSRGHTDHLTPGLRLP